jgi:hypothetical protein
MNSFAHTVPAAAGLQMHPFLISNPDILLELQQLSDTTEFFPLEECMKTSHPSQVIWSQ